MDDKCSLLKLKFYLFSSTNAEKRYEQRHLPVKDKKYESSTEPLTIRRNPYGRKIKHAEFCKCLDQVKQSSNNQFNEEGEEKHPVQMRSPVTSGSQVRRSPPENKTLQEGQSIKNAPEKRQQISNLEEQGTPETCQAGVLPRNYS